MDADLIPELSGMVCIGVDPGIHFGITILHETWVYVLWGSLPKLLHFPGLEAFALASSLIKADWQLQAIFKMGLKYVVRVEGPAYSERVGQPLLEQIRFGFAHGFVQHYGDTKYMQPNTARKLAFGSANKTGKDIWINLNPNAADSLGLAIAAAEQCLSRS